MSLARQNPQCERYGAKEMKTYANIIVALFILSGCAKTRGDPSRTESSRTDPIPGVVITKDGRRCAGDIQWEESSRTYHVTSKSNTISIAYHDVSEVRIRRESDIDKAMTLFQKAEYQQAIPLLRKAIATDRPFGSSVTAIRWLADCYLHLGQPEEVVKLFEKKMWILEEDSQWKEAADCRRIYKQALSDLQGREEP